MKDESQNLFEKIYKLVSLPLEMYENSKKGICLTNPVYLDPVRRAESIN